MDEETPDRKPLFDPTVNTFKDLIKTQTFVDHSLLIKIFFIQGQKLFVSAPPHFCKSSNLDTIRQFFEIRKDGKIEDALSQRELFADFKNLEIMKVSKKLLEDHFRAHPVLFVDFKDFVVSDCANPVRDVLDHCYHKLKTAFEQHKDCLQKSLPPSYDKRVCEMWWKSMKFEDVGSTNVKNALNVLCECLYRAYKKSVMILIDNCDAVITGALKVRLCYQAVQNVVNLFENILGGITKSGEVETQIQGVLFTGVYYICGDGVLKPVKATRCRFLDDMCSVDGDLIVRSYGLHENQLEGLLNGLRQRGKLKKFRDNLQMIKEVIKQNYEGFYTKKGKCVYSLWSILHYLQTGSCSCVKMELSPLTEICGKTFPNRSIGADVLKLVGNGQICIKYEKKIHVSSLLLDQELDRDVFFSLLLDTGFLTNVKVQKSSFGDIVGIRIPNEDVRSLFQQMIVEADVTVGGFDTDLIKQCAKTIEKVCNNCLNNDDKFKKYLSSFYTTTSLLFEGFHSSSYDLGEYFLHGLFFIIAGYSNFSNLVAEDHEHKKERVNLWLVDKSNFAFVCKIKFNKQINGVLCKENTSLHALDEVKDYLHELSVRNIQKFLLMGLSMDDACRPSFCVETSRRDRVVCASSTEVRCFPEFYKNCYNLLEKHMVG